MTNKYLSFVNDDHLLKCISNLHGAYVRAKSNIGRKEFYKNKIDIIKLNVDSKFSNINQEGIIEAELFRQIDKSINNYIGTFHEEVLGGISGYQIGNHSGYDIKAINNTLFADIKNKHNTMNSSSSESLFQKLANLADRYKKSKCYLVQILAKKSFNQKWSGNFNGKEYSHSRVYKISGDQFYSLLTFNPNAFLELYKILPTAIDDHLSTYKEDKNIIQHSAFSEIKKFADVANRKILDQIAFENFPYYTGFNQM